MALTHLEIINNILQALDLPPTNDVADNSYEVVEINRILSQQKRAVLARGYYFNTFDMEFINTNDNKVFATNDVIKLDSTDYALRGRQIWDLKKNTGTIDEPVTVSSVIDLDYEDTPYECSYYIMAKSRTLAQSKLMPDVTQTQIYKQEELDAKEDFNRFILQTYNANMIDNMPDIWRR